MVWRTYKNVERLTKDNTLQTVDLGLIHSSAASSLTELILNRLISQDEITQAVGPSKLVKYWPPALKEWTTKAARDAFFSSPSLPRLLKPDAIKKTIADGINQKLIAYAGKTASGNYEPFLFEPSTGVDESDIEISDDFVLLRAKDATAHKEPRRLARIEISPRAPPPNQVIRSSSRPPATTSTETLSAALIVTWSSTGGTIDQDGRFSASELGSFRIEARSDSVMGTATISVQTAPPPPPPPPRKDSPGTGRFPPQKWMNFYTKVLSPLVSTTPGLKLQVNSRFPQVTRAIEAKVEAAKAALRDLGLPEDVQMR